MNSTVELNNQPFIEIHLFRYINRLDATLDDMQMRPFPQILLFLRNNSLAVLGQTLHFSCAVMLHCCLAIHLNGQDNYRRRFFRQQIDQAVD